MKEYRCSKCKKLIFKGSFLGKIETVCIRCKTKNRINEKEILEVHDSTTQ